MRSLSDDPEPRKLFKSASVWLFDFVLKTRDRSSLFVRVLYRAERAPSVMTGIGYYRFIYFMGGTFIANELLRVPIAAVDKVRVVEFWFDTLAVLLKLKEGSEGR